jgi:hypothetical protein
MENAYGLIVNRSSIIPWTRNAQNDNFPTSTKSTCSRNMALSTFNLISRVALYIRPSTANVKGSPNHLRPKHPEVPTDRQLVALRRHTFEKTLCFFAIFPFSALIPFITTHIPAKVISIAFNEHVTFHDFMKKVRSIPCEMGGASISFVEDVAYQKAAIQEMERCDAAGCADEADDGQAQPVAGSSAVRLERHCAIPAKRLRGVARTDFQSRC